MTFDQWKKQVDKICSDFYGGLTTDDFEDYLWYDAFVAEESPEVAFLIWSRELDT